MAAKYGIIALSTSEDFVHWTPLKTVLKPDDYDDPIDQMYVMTPFVYGNQYIGFIGMLHSATEFDYPDERRYMRQIIITGELPRLVAD